MDGDGQSKTEVAINEAERLLNVEKVDILAGILAMQADTAINAATNITIITTGALTAVRPE